jgi:Uma2 family endonuclease
MAAATAQNSARPARLYTRPPVPLHFPEAEEMPEGDEHFQLCLLLYTLTKHAVGTSALVTSDLFVYWDPIDPKKSLAPDLAVRAGTPHESLRTWKTWERGAPHVGVEIISETDGTDRAFQEKLARYRQAGIAEVVRFDPRIEQPLRLWDFIDGDLVERDLNDPESLHCDALGFYWCVCEQNKPGEPQRVLRLARDVAGTELLPTPTEAAETSAKALLARVAELEAALAHKP